MKMVALLDCNNFFVSCERLFRPDLNKVPVVVLSSNDGCIVARSQEIKDMGIPMGVPYFKIKDMIENKGVIKFSTNFELYRDISKRVFNVVKKIVGDLEQYSIDECFFEVNETSAKEICLAVKRQVEMEVGIPVSIGVAPSKTIAKYQSKIAKRTGGFSLFNKDVWQEEIVKIRLSEIWGVGLARSNKFAEKNIITVFDFINLDSAIVSTLYGIEGIRLFNELKGEQVLAVVDTPSLPKSIMSSRSFDKETRDQNLISEALKFHVYQVIEDLKRHNLAAKSISINVSPNRFGDFFMHACNDTTIFEEGTRDMFKLQNACMKMLSKGYKKGVPYKKAGILVTQLLPENMTTSRLFSEKTSQNDKDTLVISDVVLSLNKKLGKEKILLGRLTTSDRKWQGKKDFLSRAYTTKWSDIKTVRSA